MNWRGIALGIFALCEDFAVNAGQGVNTTQGKIPKSNGRNGAAAEAAQLSFIAFGDGRSCDSLPSRPNAL
ncbi:MAG TPA: hypothetical protein VKP58_13795 [Candidatus Acidoferrum sp.]|nr:hypothetical protein [Candidatus Acidoferrum sp.]